jgi:hypothetical protein
MWYLAGGVALGYVAMFLFTSLSRVTYPYELEWLEGSMVDHVGWILDGHPLYAQPCTAFTSSLYTPLYFYLGAAICKIVGLGFTPLRVISLLSVIGCMVVMYAMVRRESGERLGGILAAGLFAASFAACGGFFDIVRVDSFFLLLLIITAYLVRFATTRPALLLAAFLGTLAYLTKQSALLPLGGITVWAAFQGRTRLCNFVIPLIVLAVASFLWLDYLFDGWMRFYSVTIPTGHPIRPEFLLSFWTDEMARYMAVALVLTLLWIGLSFRSDKWTSIFWLLFVGGALVAACLGRAKAGGYINNFALASFALSMSGLIAAFKLRDLLQNRLQSWLPQAALIFLLLIQFSILWYDPSAFIPTAKDRAAGDQFVASLRIAHGRVLIPWHGYYARMAGKPPHAHRLATTDVCMSDQNYDYLLGVQMQQAVLRQDYDLIAYDYRASGDIVRRYQLGPTPFDNDSSFYPVVGGKLRPTYWYYPQ